jgi:formylglycine-generating enzyme required for sulfatase activity
MLFVLLATMVFIPGGKFQMGSAASAMQAKFPGVGSGMREMLKAESPQIPVTIEPFYIDKYEVTNEQFLYFTKEHPEYASRTWAGGANDPVTHVTWYAAKAYCAWQYKRLPTEAEWEYAARGGSSSADYPWGADPPDPQKANFAASKIGFPVPVGKFPPNGYGLYDMAGNVWEFTADNWRETHDATPSTTPGSRKVIRGGSFGADPLQLRVTFRDSHKPDDPVAHVGFRCARDGK